jgi:hypothetical protein
MLFLSKETMTTRNIDIELLKKDLIYLKNGIDDIKEELKCIRDEKISRVEFTLVNKQQDDRIKKVESLVFGAIGLTLTTIGMRILDFFTNGGR